MTQIANAILFGAILGGVLCLCHLFWKKEALRHAATWATANGMKLIDEASSSFRMHRTRPHIVVSAMDQDGKVFRCDLVLRLSLVSPLGNWRDAELVEQYELEQWHAG